MSPGRRQDIIKECKTNQIHFVCHNSSEKENICCKKFFDELGHYSQSIRIAERLNVVEFVPQTNDKKLFSHRDSNKK